MRLPLSWLRDYVEFDLAPEQLAERLTLLGMEVQAIDRIGAGWRDVVTGELLEVAPHPATDRLSLTRVRVDGANNVLSIVCGATNIAAGQRVPVALPGAVLPGDRRIGVSRIQGQESQGMLCSGDELGLTADADGILILPAATAVGLPLERVLGEVVLDVDVKPNRGDALSLVGLAREVAAITGAPLRWPEIRVPEQGDATTEHVSVEVREPLLCPRFVARYVDGVTVAPSPLFVQLRLTAAGIRTVSNVVDATNYVMLELGKPVHAFDAAAVSEGRIVVRRAEAGERLLTLDHVERTLDPDTLLIADPARALAIGGVMGGADSEVGSGASAVIIESAIFDPIAIRRTAQRHGLRSEASARFEKGQEHRLARLGADRTAQLVAEWADGRVAHGAVDTDPIEPPLARVPFRISRVSRVLGVAIPRDEIRDLLRRVGIPTEPPEPGDAVPIIDGEAPIPLAPTDAPSALVAVVPSHRRDLAIEADIVEEVCRLRGYDSLPGRLPDTPTPSYRTDPWELRDRVRDALSGRGLVEVVTHALLGPDDHGRIGLAGDDPLTVRAANPVSIDHSELRRSMLPGLLRVLAHNERQRRADLGVFEAGLLYEMRPDGPVETPVLAILLAGAWQPGGWDRPARAADVADVKGLVEALLERLGAGRVRYEPAPRRPGVEHPGRTAAVIAEVASGHRIELGVVGEVHPALVASYEVRAEHVVFASLDLTGLARVVPERLRVDQLARLPAVERDLAVLVQEDRPAGDVGALIRLAAGPLLADMRLFDRYQGPPLAPGELSLAYRLRFQPTGEPMADERLDTLMEEIARTLRERLGARVRGPESG